MKITIDLKRSSIKQLRKLIRASGNLETAIKAAIDYASTEPGCCTFWAFGNEKYQKWARSREEELAAIEIAKNIR